jgi:glycosyltransferase involved in cell wall biosynthesis
MQKKSGNSKQKKIMFIIHSLTGGGAERVLINIINHMDQTRNKITLIIFEDKIEFKDEIKNWNSIVCLNKRSPFDFFKIILQLRKHIQNFKPEVVVSFLFYASIVTVLSVLGLKTVKKIVIREGNTLPEYLLAERFSYLKKCLIKYTYKKASYIIAVSKGVKYSLIKELSLPYEKVKIVYNPVPLDEIESSTHYEIRHPFFESKNSHIVIGSGRLVAQKRFDRLIRAFSLLLKNEENARLIILGKGPLKAELEELAINLGIDNCIDLVGFQSNPYSWLAKADTFVLSSDYEGFPMTLLEAMACGVPIVSVDCPSGPSELIENGKNGILVQQNDEMALAEGMINLLKNERLRKRFSIEGKKRILNFRIEKIMKQYESLI